MDLDHWPWKPAPDCTRLVEALSRQGDRAHVPFFDGGGDPEMIGAVLGEKPLGAHFSDERRGSSVDRQALEKQLDQKIRFCYRLGQDAIAQGASLRLHDVYRKESDDTAHLSRDKRRWVDEQAGVITNWAEFESYRWPRAADADLYPLVYVGKHLPEGMGIVSGYSGVLEAAMWLTGYQTFALALYDQPDLIQALFDRIAEIWIPLFRAVVEMDGVIALRMGDDMGFKTGTMIDPDHLRKYVFPIQKRIVQVAHEHGLPFILHACGNLEAVMDDLIDDVGIDAKHSFEDVIEPVESFTARYGHRVAIVGGVDMDILARGSEEQVRARTRQIVEACAPSRAYTLGTGNTVANYIPPGNYLAMLDEGWRYNEGE